MPPSTSFEVRIDPSKLAEIMRSPSGPFVRRLIEDGELVKTEAQRLVGVHTPQPGERRSRRPGTLRDSIVKRIVDVGGVVTVQVGTDDPIARWHHEGTEPHPIDAPEGGFLVFYWPVTGKVMFVKQVQHPGTRPNRFLVNAMRVLAGRY